LQAVTGTSVPSVAWTPISLDTIVSDATGGYISPNWQAPSTSADPPIGAGPAPWYLVTGLINWPNSSSTASSFGVGLVKNTDLQHEGTRTATASTHPVNTPVIDLYQLANGDTIHLAGWQNTGAAVVTNVSGHASNLNVRWVCNGSGTVVASPPTPHTWIAQDEASADAVGASAVPPGVKVPLNREIRDAVRWLNYPPIARLTNETATAQTVASSTTVWTTINLSTATVDTYTGWASSPNPTRYTVQRSGVYFVAGLGALNDPSSTHAGQRGVRLLVNGTTQYGGNMVAPTAGTSTIPTVLYAVDMIRLTAGDYVELQMIQNQGAALALASGTNGCRIVIVWMSQ
jgi:hypothetical protein